MEVRQKEKDWIRRLGAGTQHEQKTETACTARDTCPDTMNVRKGRGFCDVAGMDDLKRMFTDSFINVLNNRECAKVYGITPPSILLYGPSGCGKTFLAEKISDEIGVNFIKVIPDDLASTLVHGTQQKIGELFRKAEQKAPVLLFFDEFDAMVPSRSADDRNCQNGEVNEFLCMLNNTQEKGIYVLAATNHPERIDRAVLRTGRIDEIIYVDLPDAKSREELFRLELSKIPVSDDIDYVKLADSTQGYNCSDISYIVKSASRKMFNATISSANKEYQPVTQLVLEKEISGRMPSVHISDLREFERIRCEFTGDIAVAHSAPVGFH